MDEESRKKAIELAGGPLGKEMAKFPLLFAKAAFYGQRPSRNRPTQVNNGTIALVDFGSGLVGITCWHILADYRTKQNELSNLIFQIGDTELDPVAQLIDENERLDIAVIQLTGDQAAEITLGGKIGSTFFRPLTWPPPSPKEGEYVSFGGFPASMRTLVSFDEIEFPSWSSGASTIFSVSEYQFVSAFERAFWVKSFGAPHHMDLTALGGLSGSPAFINRGLYWDLVGIVSEYHENYDTMFFASLKSVRPDGTIEPPIVEPERERGR